MGRTSRQAIFAVLLLGVTAVWGWTFTVVRDAVSSYPVMGFLAIRFALATLVMAPLGARRLDLRGWGVGLGIGLALAAGYVLQTAGLRSTTPTNSGLITGLFVLFAAVWNRALFGVRTRRGYPWLVLCSLLGLGLLTGGGLQRPTLGDLLTLGCAVAFGLHVALLDRYAGAYSVRGLALAQLAATAGVCAVAWPAVEPLLLPGPAVWQAIVLCGVVASAGAFLIQTAAQRELPAAQAAMILTMEPVFAGWFGHVLSGDALTGLQYAGGGLMLAALLAANLGSAPEQARLEA